MNYTPNSSSSSSPWSETSVIFDDLPSTSSSDATSLFDMDAADFQLMDCDLRQLFPESEMIEVQPLMTSSTHISDAKADSLPSSLDWDAWLTPAVVEADTVTAYWNWDPATVAGTAEAALVDLSSTFSKCNTTALFPSSTANFSIMASDPAVSVSGSCVVTPYHGDNTAQALDENPGIITSLLDPNSIPKEVANHVISDIEMAVLEERLAMLLPSNPLPNRTVIVQEALKPYMLESLQRSATEPVLSADQGSFSTASVSRGGSVSPVPSLMTDLSSSDLASQDPPPASDDQELFYTPAPAPTFPDYSFRHIWTPTNVLITNFNFEALFPSTMIRSRLACHFVRDLPDNFILITTGPTGMKTRITVEGDIRRARHLEVVNSGEKVTFEGMEWREELFKAYEKKGVSAEMLAMPTGTECHFPSDSRPDQPCGKTYRNSTHGGNLSQWGREIATHFTQFRVGPLYMCPGCLHGFPRWDCAKRHMQRPRGCLDEMEIYFMKFIFEGDADQKFRVVVLEDRSNVVGGKRRASTSDLESSTRPAKKKRTST